jgi:gliding motility-associated-like protein
MSPNPDKSRLKYYNLFLFLLLGGAPAFGQLNVDFSMDKTGGCSPVIVNFASTTTGASPGAVYKWDFGNGNASALIQAAAVYTEEQTYTVTLTVQDGANQSTRSKQITVYKPPVIADFSLDAAKICLGSPTTFTANASPGDGSIAGYYWDFGDGSTAQNTFNVQSYTYSSEQVATVSLTVTNIYGCHTTLKKPNIIKVIPALTASFAADKRVLCLVTDAVQFTNNSSGPGALDYLWDFADGTTSTTASPNHIFNKKGDYSVSLRVHSSEGCTVVSTQTNPLDVANYNTSFSIPTPICLGSYVSFNSQSTPAPDNSSWQVDGVTQSFYFGSFYTSFSTAGDHTITLNNVFGTCPQTASQKISVKAPPAPNGFVATIAGKCGSPVAVNFKDQTSGAVQWQWNFDLYNDAGVYLPGSSTQQSPTFTYTADANYLVYLLVTNADGCSASTSQTVSIHRPNVSISAQQPYLTSCTTMFTNSFGTNSSEPLVSTQWNFGDSTTSSDPNPTHIFKNTPGIIYTVSLNYTTVNGCTGVYSINQYYQYPPLPVQVYTNPSNVASCLSPITATFTTSSQDPLVTTNWTLGDDSSSTSASPTHTYTNTGTYVATLSYVTQAGCKGVVNSPPVIIDPKIKMALTDFPNPVCGSNAVSFLSSTNTPDINTYNWDYGDGNTYYTSGPGASHRYGAPGTYTINLYVRNIGGCDTSLTTSVTVLPPFPRIVTYINTCSGTRGAVTFIQSSVQATSVTWSFGDGATLTIPGNQDTVIHVYKKSGSYNNITLTATNGSCTLSTTYPYTVYVLLKQSPVLTGSQTSVCTNGSVAIQITNLDPNPLQGNIIYSSYYSSGYYFSPPAGVQYRDGTPFQGFRTDPTVPTYPYYYRWTTTYNSTLSNFQANEKDLRFIMTSNGFGCEDTTNFIPLLVKGATGGFEVVSDHLCYQSPVLLKDTSSTTGNNPILSWQWDFGDGQTLRKTKGGSLSHVYANPGSYQVSMQITDAAGCSPGIPYQQNVVVNGPKASFTPSGTDVHLNTTVYFYNTTNDFGNTNTVYSWDFGDGSTSNDPSPFHTYPVPGTYMVTMTAANPSLPCSSTATPVTIIVRNFNSAFGFNSYYIAGACPPLLVYFNNTSYGYMSVDWDFGDGITAGNVNYASHIYERPGMYIVTLNVHGYNGLEGKFIDSILIREPLVSLGAPPPESCIGSTIKLSSTAQNASSFMWDFGDGTVVPSANGTAQHQYLTAGTYTATLLMANASGCITDTTLQSPVKIRPNPVITFTPPGPVILCKDAFVDLSATGGSVYQWSPATGLSDPTISDPVASPESTIDYTLTVKDDIGCTNTAPLTVQVIPPGDLQVSKDDTVCAGETAQLKATGEIVYQWIDDITGLSDTAIPNPVSLAPVTTTYTVKGSDAYYCFVDQRSVTVTVRPLPTVNAGQNVLVEAGYNTTLDAIGSSDVVTYNWQPARYLNCYNCASPLSTPLATISYTVTVKNQYGCKASDTVVVAVDCQESHVRVPNAFTPDGNGMNDVFIIKGISIIKHMVIFDRWGEKVYERDNFIAGDRSSCWDGSYKGHKCPTGAYVYFVEMECPAGGTFSREGSFVLIR